MKRTFRKHVKFVIVTFQDNLEGTKKIIKKIGLDDSMPLVCDKPNRIVKEYFYFSTFIIDKRGVIRWMYLGNKEIRPRTELVMRKLEKFTALQQNPSGAFAALKELKSDDPAARRAAARLLGVYESKAAIPELVSLLRSDEDNGVRTAAATALGRYNLPDVVGALIEGLKDKEKEVRLASAKALFELGNTIGPEGKSRFFLSDNKILKQAGASLVDALCQSTKDKETEVRRFAVSLILRIGANPASQDSLAKLTDVETDAETKNYAIEFLAKYGDSKVVPLLLNNAETIPTDKKLIVIEGLGRLADRRALPFLLKALKDKNTKIRSRSARGLARLKDDALPYIKEMLFSDDNGVRTAALDSLNEIRDGSLVADLVRIYQTPDLSVAIKQKAVAALGSYAKNPEALKTLDSGIQDESVVIQKAAANALAKNLTKALEPEITTSLKKGLDSDSTNIVLTVAEAFAKFQDKAILPVLLDEVNNVNDNFRQKARNALQKATATKAIVPALAKLLASDEDQVQSQATEALVEILSDKNKSVRKKAIAAVADAKIKEAIPELIRIAEQDSDFELQLTAVKSLGNFNDKSAIEALTHFSILGEAAAGALKSIEKGGK